MIQLILSTTNVKNDIKNIKNKNNIKDIKNKSNIKNINIKNKKYSNRNLELQ